MVVSTKRGAEKYPKCEQRILKKYRHNTTPSGTITLLRLIDDLQKFNLVTHRLTGDLYNSK
jgi:hypothetical protein